MRPKWEEEDGQTQTKETKRFRYLGAAVAASPGWRFIRSSPTWTRGGVGVGDGLVLVLHARPSVVPERPGEREVPAAARTRVRLLARVNPGVPPQLPGSDEGLVALRAAVRLFSRVCPHVGGQRPLLRKRLPAVGAVVGRDAGVEALVPHQRPRQGEPFVAVGALVRPLSRVSPLVVPQLRCGVAALVTVGTRELLPREAGDHLRVHGLQVRFQVPVSGKAFEADGAVVRPLAGVSAAVQPELALAGKPFFTERARKRLLPRVDPLVDQEQTLLWKSLLAHGAGERPLSGVRAQVALKLGCVGEVFAAHRAAVEGRRLFVLTVEGPGGSLCWQDVGDCSSSWTEREEKAQATRRTESAADAGPPFI